MGYDRLKQTQSTKLNEQVWISRLPSNALSLKGSLTLGSEILAQVQVTVTPKLDGTLKIVGVRWKLSDSVAGFYNFNSDFVKKTVATRRSKTKRPTTDNLEFMVIKALPKVEGFIRHLPKTVYAGDLRRLDLVLKNPSAISVKNMKMKISHPRFLLIGNQEVMDLEFPACLEKKTNSARIDTQTITNYASDSVFQFPEDALIHGETPFVWPLWIRAATHGNISLYITVYYEMGDTSTVMKYRTLRIHYNLEVLPSLAVSFQISPCPLILGEFLVRMDVVNRTSSKSFQVHQLSSVGNAWEISLLQPIDAILPSDLLLAGQALLCFFKLKISRKSVPIDDEYSSTSPHEGSDVSLSHGSNDLLFDISRSPFVDFHHYERVHRGTANQEKSNTVDFILISRQQRNEGDSEEHNSCNLLSYHACD